jgi:Cof subfamily protein (haloacid dehalogenase superfamily)
MTPKLIATDLDGTLLRSDGTPSERTLAALRAAHGASMHVVVATARPYRALAPLIDAQPFEGWGVCQNGAVTYHLASRERVAIQVLDHGHARRIVADLRSAFDGVVFACEVDDVFSCEPGFRTGLQAMEPEAIVYGDALELITSPLTKLLAHHEAMAPADLALAATRIAGEHAVVTYSGARFVEISAAGVTKAAGVAAICQRLGVESRDVIAFGDAHNDLAMMRWAGHRVAVSNAHGAVLSEAHEVAPSNDDDGVAEIIERLLGR